MEDKVTKSFRKPALACMSLSVVVVAIAWIPVCRSIAWRRDYVQAEGLVQLVWPLAGEMKRFNDENGRLPATLEEITHFSKQYDFSPLSIYRPEFRASGECLFYLKVNTRFSFEINKQFSPKWAKFSGVFEKPRESAGVAHGDQ